VRPSRALRILTVDDEPAIGTMVKRTLRRGGHQVTVATSAEEALDRLAAEPFDLVIPDLRVGPGLTGYDLARQVRERWPSVRFVLATGSVATITPDEAAGVHAVLTKPYSADELERLAA
jgi:CheY-like chemotaxis protein